MALNGQGEQSTEQKGSEGARQHGNDLILTLPHSRASLTPFPPGCRVLLVRDAATAKPVILAGKVTSVFVDLSPGSLRNNQYEVKLEDSQTHDDEKDGLAVSEEAALRYAPGVPCSVSQSAEMARLASGVDGGEQLDGTVLSSWEAGGVCMYSIKLRMGQQDVVQHGVPPANVMFRQVVQDESVTKEMKSSSVAKPSVKFDPGDDCSALTTDSALPSATVPSVVDTSKREKVHALESERGGVESPPKRSKQGDTRKICVRRIDIPKALNLSVVAKELIGTKGSIQNKMEENLRCKIWLCDENSSPTFGDLAKYGDITPVVGERCVMIRGYEEDIVNNAVKVIIHIFARAYNDDQLKSQLISSVRQTNVVDSGVSDPLFASPSNGQGAKTMKSPKEGVLKPAIASTPQLKRDNSRLGSSSERAGCAQAGAVVFRYDVDGDRLEKDVCKRIYVPDWLDVAAAVLIGKGGANVKRIGRATKCRINVQDNDASRRDSLYVDITGANQQNVDRACLLVEDMLIDCVDECEVGRLLYDLAAFSRHGIRNASMRNGGRAVYQRSYFDRKMVWMNYVPLPSPERARQLNVNITGVLLGSRGSRNREMRKLSGCHIDILGMGSSKKNRDSRRSCNPYVMVSSHNERNVAHGVRLVRSAIQCALEEHEARSASKDTRKVGPEATSTMELAHDRVNMELTARRK